MVTNPNPKLTHVSGLQRKLNQQPSRVRVNRLAREGYARQSDRAVFFVLDTPVVVPLDFDRVGNLAIAFKNTPEMISGFGSPVIRYELIDREWFAEKLVVKFGADMIFEPKEERFSRISVGVGAGGLIADLFESQQAFVQFGMFRMDGSNQRIDFSGSGDLCH